LVPKGGIKVGGYLGTWNKWGQPRVLQWVGKGVGDPRVLGKKGLATWGVKVAQGIFPSGFEFAGHWWRSVQLRGTHGWEEKDIFPEDNYGGKETPEMVEKSSYGANRQKGGGKFLLLLWSFLPL